MVSDTRARKRGPRKRPEEFGRPEGLLERRLRVPKSEMGDAVERERAKRK